MQKIVDRREAIQKAVAMAEAGDVILIAGKGHETYQIFPDKTIHFDDIEEVRKAFGEDCLWKKITIREIVKATGAQMIAFGRYGGSTE